LDSLRDVSRKNLILGFWVLNSTGNTMNKSVKIFKKGVLSLFRKPVVFSGLPVVDNAVPLPLSMPRKGRGDFPAVLRYTFCRFLHKDRQAFILFVWGDEPAG
jgi:hypothetical protein